MRVYVKQKLQQAIWKAKAQSGQSNNADGIWGNAPSDVASGPNGTAGAKANKSEKDRRPYKGGRVHWTKKV